MGQDNKRSFEPKIETIKHNVNWGLGSSITKHQTLIHNKSVHPAIEFPKSSLIVDWNMWLFSILPPISPNSRLSSTKPSHFSLHSSVLSFYCSYFTVSTFAFTLEVSFQL
ncbi:hypothetical protein Hdeb2414_s0026g00673831 [Helianthus debilis subsp. tardiflorus]